MTELDDALEQQMASIVFEEHRPFCVNDFLIFEWEGKEFKPHSGTIRNKFSEFKQKGIIEPDYRTNTAYYTLKDHRFEKIAMTPYPAGVTISRNHPMYKILQHLVLDKVSFHNVHLTFTLPKVYNIFSHTHLPRIERSKQIVIPWWKKNNVSVRTVISKTDTVSMTIASSLQPIPLDFKGFNYLTLILGNIAGRLQTHLDMIMVNHHEQIDQIPDCGKWLIKEWHLNCDGLQEYTGKGFSITFETAQHIIYRIYTKQFSRHKHLRIERQDIPNTTVEEIKNLIDNKLNSF